MFITAEWSRAKVFGSMRASEAEEADREVYKRTLEEVGEGKAVGAYSMGELLKEPCQLVPGRRVGLPQSGGHRPTDDFSESRQNATSATWEKVDLSWG